MLFPVLSFADLAEAVILFTASTLTLKKLYQGSKSNFAYLLVAFTLANAICRFGIFMFNKFPNETVEEPNGYAYLSIS